VLRDRVEVLAQVEARNSPLSPALLAALKRYRQGLDLDEAERRNEAQRAFEQVYQDPAADFLRAHALYQMASMAYEWLDFPRAAVLYQRVVQEFPQAPKREEALLMLARSTLLPEAPP